MTLTASSSQDGIRSNGNKHVIHIPQISETAISMSDADVRRGGILPLGGFAVDVFYGPFQSISRNCSNEPYLWPWVLKKYALYLSSHADSTKFPENSPPTSIIHRSWQVFYLLRANVSICWLASTGTSTCSSSELM